MKPAEFDHIRALLVRYADRLQDKNDEPPGQYLIAHALLKAVEMLDLLLSASAPGGEIARAVDDAIGECRAAVMRCYYGSPSTWGAKNPASWHLTERNCTPTDAAMHDNGLNDALMAIGRVRAEIATKYIQQGGTDQ
jgi:hypothetical protein